jgi:hypothetical protein
MVGMGSSFREEAEEALEAWNTGTAIREFLDTYSRPHLGHLMSPQYASRSVLMV